MLALFREPGYVRWCYTKYRIWSDFACNRLSYRVLTWFLGWLGIVRIWPTLCWDVTCKAGSCWIEIVWIESIWSHKSRLIMFLLSFGWWRWMGQLLDLIGYALGQNWAKLDLFLTILKLLHFCFTWVQVYY